MPPDPGCHLPPPDDYEEDDSWGMWSPYTGQPQVHNFDRAGDQDWVAVFIAEPTHVRFETKNLQHNADTLLKVFEFDNHVMGGLLGWNDDVGGGWWDLQRKRSRVDLQLPGGTAYLIQVVNKGPASQFETQHQWPTYTLSLSAL